MGYSVTEWDTRSNTESGYVDKYEFPPWDKDGLDGASPGERAIGNELIRSWGRIPPLTISESFKVYTHYHLSIKNPHLLPTTGLNS